MGVYSEDLSVSVANLGKFGAAQNNRLAVCFDADQGENSCQLLEYTSSILSFFAPVLPDFATFPTRSFNMNLLAAGDFNGDGANDLVLDEFVISGSDLSVIYDLLLPFSEGPGLENLANTLLVASIDDQNGDCLLYTSPSPRDGLLSRMPSSA